MQFSRGWLLFLLFMFFLVEYGYLYHIFISGSRAETHYSWVLYLTLIFIYWSLIGILHSFLATVDCQTQVCVVIANEVSFKISVSDLLDEINRKYHIQKGNCFLNHCKWWMALFFSNRYWIPILLIWKAILSSNEWLACITGLF